MSGNKAPEGSAILLNGVKVDPSVDTDGNSVNYINHTTFSDNDNVQNAAVYLDYTTGSIDIINNTFEDNINSDYQGSCIFVNSDQKLKIESNKFERNQGFVISSAETANSVIDLSGNSFLYNNGQAISVKRATVKDNSSIYENSNSPGSGSCITLASNSKYTG